LKAFQHETGTPNLYEKPSSVKKWLGLRVACALIAFAAVGISPLSAQERPLQEVVAPAGSAELLLLRAEQITRQGDVFTCVGKVKAEFQGLQLDCQWLRYNVANGQVEARRECIFSFGDSFAAAEEIDFSLGERRALLRRVVGRGNDLSSSDKFIEQPLFFWADTMVWQPDLMELTKATVTTCDAQPGHWDYRIVAERIEIIPQDKLIAYESAVEFGDFRPITLPRLTFSLNPDQPRVQDYLPTVGFSALFGAFLRFSIPYSFDRQNSGRINLDYFTRTGFSGGVEQTFNWDNRLLGELYYYQQPGVGDRDGRLDFRTNMVASLSPNTTATFNYSQNRFELPNFSSPLTVSTQLGLTHQVEDMQIQAQAGFARSGDNTNSYYVGSLQKDFGERTRFLLTGDYAVASTLAQRTQRFHYLTSIQHRADLFDVEAALESTSGQRTYYINRTPELRFVARPIYLGDVPILASASYARIFESPSETRANRWDLRVSLPDQMYSLGSSRFIVGAGLRQFFYDNDDKQRAWLARASWYQPLGEEFTARVDFNLQDAAGRTPFLHDFHTSFRVLTGGLEYHNSGSLRLGAYAGYDLLKGQPHDLVGRLDYTPAPEFGISSGSNFDPNRGRFRSVDNMLSLRLGDGVSLSHWSLYDFEQNRLTYQDVMLNFESHDWVASLAYRGLQREVFFQLNLKGFPSPSVHVGPETGVPVLPYNLSNPYVR